jgi:type VI secretion system protein ImpM
VTAGAVLGLFGKLPAHGDFVRRGLPSSFCDAWDAWLARGMAAARGSLGENWEGVWDASPVWRFALPAGACGPDPVAGVMAPSQDSVGRRFPLTVAAVLPGAIAGFWPPGWFAEMEGMALEALELGMTADRLVAALPTPFDDPDLAEPPEPGWWTAGSAEAPGLVWPLPALPEPEEFLLLLEAPP